MPLTRPSAASERGRGAHASRSRAPEVEKDIRRIVARWEDCRRAHLGEGGPFLFGAFGNADAMCAPVVARFRTFGAGLRR